MAAKSNELPNIIGHWNHLFEGLQCSSQEFYARLEKAVQDRNLPDTQFGRIEIKEGGLLSARRTYLRVMRKDFIFDCCAAPFGKGFFVSWWLGEQPSGCFLFLLSIPVINILAWLVVKPITYYKIDTAHMFQSAVHCAVLEVLDQVTGVDGVRALSESERKPIMREFFASAR